MCTLPFRIKNEGLAQIGNYVGDMELARLHQERTDKISRFAYELSLLNARLRQIDPKLIGESRNANELKYLFSKIKRVNEVSALLARRLQIQKNMDQAVDERYNIETTALCASAKIGLLPEEKEAGFEEADGFGDGAVHEESSSTDVIDGLHLLEGAVVNFP